MVQRPLPFIDYTSRDFESVKESLVEYLTQRFPDDFTDFSESQLGIAMLEMVAYSYAIISFMLDRQVNEVFIDTARDRKSIINLAALVGYKLTSATAASVDLLVDTEALAKFSGPVFIAKGTATATGTLTFEIDKDYTIQRIGNSPGFSWSINGEQPLPIVPISATEGETFSDSFTADGSAFLRLRLSVDFLIDGSLSVTVSNVTWTLVDSLTLGDPDDPDNGQIYEITLDENDRADLRFGDSVTGDIVLDGSAIVATYRSGGGSRGNIAVGAISQSINAVHNGIDQIVVGVINPVKGSGGTDREALDHARLFAPQWARTTDRAVTYQDYWTLTNGYTDGVNGTIEKAGIIADPTDGISNTVTVYVWAADANGNLSTASLALKGALQQFLEARRTLSVFIAPIQDGINIAVDITALIRVGEEFDNDATITEAELVLDALFRDNRVKFGNELRVSWISEALQDIAGVDWVHVKKFGSITDPAVVEGFVEEIENGSLPVQTVPANKAVITVPASRAADFYCNYRLRVGSQTKRIIGSTVSTGTPATVIVTLDSNLSPPVGTGEAFRITHPRRVRLDSNASSTDDIYNGRVLIVTPNLGVSQERSILAWDGTTRVAVVNKDWNEAPTAGLSYRIAPDFRVIDSEAIVAGTVIVQSIV